MNDFVKDYPGVVLLMMGLLWMTVQVLLAIIVRMGYQHIMGAFDQNRVDHAALCTRIQALEISINGRTSGRPPGAGAAGHSMAARTTGGR